VASAEHGIPTSQGWLNVVDGVFHNARRRPGHPAIEHAQGVLTYRELADLIDRSALELQRRGVRPGDIVGVALGDDADHLVALFAVAWIGAVILPMDVRWTREEKRRILAHFGAHHVLVPPGDEPFEAVQTLTVDADWHRAVAASPGGCVPVRRREQPLVLSLSSGTTGMPKGPMVTHGHILSRLFIYTVSLTFNEADRFLAATPLYFGGGRNMSMAYLFIGATVVLHPPPFTPESLAGTIAGRRISSVFLVPTLLRRLLDMPKPQVPLFPGLRLLVSSGSSLYPDERRALMRELSPNFLNFYSSTEGGGISVLRPEHPDSASMSVGQVVFGAEVQVVDDAHRPVPPGVVGAVRYRGGSVADGFYRNPEDSAAAFREGWYYPGDLGRFDEDGFLYLTGRSKEMIIRGGINIYPAEIEHALAAHPAVLEAAVVGWPSQSRGEEIAAFVVCRQPIAEAALLAACRQVLAPYKVPRAIFVVDELPRNSLGKVTKPRLVEGLPRIG
jgi:acyl-CoA synthetase (AMP-forming)/AMP-acid ligase II